MKKVKRGEIYYADLSPIIGSEQDGMRPVLVLQNDVGNKHSPTTMGAVDKAIIVSFGIKYMEVLL